MKRVIAFAACAALLASCQTFDDAVAKNLPKTCQAAATVHASFTVVAAEAYAAIVRAYRDAN